MQCSIEHIIGNVTSTIAVGVISAEKLTITETTDRFLCSTNKLHQRKLGCPYIMSSTTTDYVEKKVLSISDEGFHRIAYRVFGDDKPNKPTVLCVHGLTRLSHDFTPLARALSKDYRVICPDLPGRGNSSWLRKQRNYNFLQYCVDISTLIARLDVKELHYLGTSLGGMIGMTLAARRRNPFKSLVINDAGPEPKLGEIRRLGRYIGKAPEFGSLREARHYIEDIYRGFGPLSKEQWKTMAAYSTIEYEDAYVMHYDPKMGDAFRSSYLYLGYNMWNFWRKISCPIHVIRGELSSFLTEETTQRMIQRGYDVSLQLVPDCGHAPLLWSEAEITPIKAFIDSVENHQHQAPDD